MWSTARITVPINGRARGVRLRNINIINGLKSHHHRLDHVRSTLYQWTRTFSSYDEKTTESENPDAHRTETEPETNRTSAKIDSPNSLNRPVPSGIPRFSRQISPARRLGSLLSPEYWQTQEQTVLDSVEQLGTLSNNEQNDTKKPQKTEEARHNLLEPFKWGQTVLITVIKPSNFNRLVPYKRFIRAVAAEEKEDTMSFYRFGKVLKKDIIGKRPPLMLKSDTNTDLLISHPTMEEFMDLMRKEPKCLTPRVNKRVLCNMTVGSGDTVFEAGSGSGCVSLLLSNLVGAEGLVDSFELVPLHSKLSGINVDYAKATFKDFPNNVKFNIGDTTNLDLENMYDFMYLDLPSLLRASPSVIHHLRPGKTLCFISPSISKFEQAFEYVSRQKLPLWLESVHEVTDTQWALSPTTLQPMYPQHKELGTIFISKWRRILSEKEQGENTGDENRTAHQTLDPALSPIIPTHGGHFEYGDAVMVQRLFQPKKERLSRGVFVLKPGGMIGTHHGNIWHDNIVLGAKRSMEGRIEKSEGVRTEEQPMDSNTVTHREQSAMGDQTVEQTETIQATVEQAEQVEQSEQRGMEAQRRVVREDRVRDGSVISTSKGSKVIIYRATLAEAVEETLDKRNKSTHKMHDYSFGFELSDIPGRERQTLLIGQLCPRVYMAAYRAMGESGTLYTQTPGEEVVQFVQEWCSKVGNQGKLTQLQTIAEDEKIACDGVLITEPCFKEDDLQLAINSSKIHALVTVMSKRLDTISEYLAWLNEHDDQGLSFYDLTQSYDRQWLLRKANFDVPNGDEDMITPFICRPAYKNQDTPGYYLRLRRTPVKEV